MGSADSVFCTIPDYSNLFFDLWEKSLELDSFSWSIGFSWFGFFWFQSYWIPGKRPWAGLLQMVYGFSWFKLSDSLIRVFRFFDSGFPIPGRKALGCTPSGGDWYQLIRVFRFIRNSYSKSSNFLRGYDVTHSDILNSSIGFLSDSILSFWMLVFGMRFLLMLYIQYLPIFSS